MNARTFVIAVTLVLGLHLFSSRPEQGRCGDPKSATCKYVICLLNPKAKIVEGSLKKDVFERLFTRAYTMGGQRASPPAGSKADGVLIVTDDSQIFTLPIMNWKTRKGKSLYLCQGTSDPGQPPEFSVSASSCEALVAEIVERLK